jgi:hypothetical protein
MTLEDLLVSYYFIGSYFIQFVGYIFFLINI